jgi:quinoprotein glucose dehydrogenase
LKARKLALLAATGLVVALGISLATSRPFAAEPQVRQDWPIYGGSTAGDRFSQLTQINRSNVARLQEVWRIPAGARGGLETTPLVVGRTLYAYTTGQQVFAADAATGKMLWTFDAGIAAPQPARGLTWWSDGREQRLFAGIMHRLYALDPATGKPIPSFGENGSVDLRKELGGDYARNVTYMTSPGVIYKDLIIVGFRTSEVRPAPPGWIRAYDVHTGKLRWAFHTIPAPGEPGAETWPKEALSTAGAANNWAGMIVDAKRGIVFAPTGSAVNDMYGADRKGDNLYADTLLALDAATGRRLWHFQGVHHDLWDRDFPSPPVLLTVKRDGRRIDAVAQATKQGFVFVFERATGRPLFPIVEKPVPASDVPGEAASPTQPAPLAPAPFARQRLTEDLLTTRTEAAHAWAVDAYRKLRNEGPFTPLAAGRQTILFPGFDGGAEWGGQAVDPRKGIFYVNANDVAATVGLVAHGGAARGPGQEAYMSQCASCHGADRAGSPPQFPSLVGLDQRLSAAQVAARIHDGGGRMPGFPDLKGTTLDALIDYVRTGREDPPDAGREVAPAKPADASYYFTGFHKFQDPEGYPAVKPPWGTLNAIDLNTGKYLWSRPLGEYPTLAAQGQKDTGSENYGGPIVTAGGVLIIGATVFDNKIRAFDADTGRQLWEAALPFAGNATPVTYMVDGRQYVVIAASGGKNRKGPQGAAYVAFALPK